MVAVEIFLSAATKLKILYRSGNLFCGGEVIALRINMSICSWLFFCNLYLIQLVYFFIMSGACTITTAADGRNLWATRVLSISQHCSHYTTVSRQIGRGGGCKAKWNRQSRVRKIVTSARSVSAAAALEETAVLDAFATRASRVSVVDASIPRSAARQPTRN